MKTIKRILFILPLVLVVIYFMGPNPPAPELNLNLPSLPSGMKNLEAFIAQKESDVNIKPDNESRFLWANDSLKERTRHSLLYLHGFSASWMEGYPANAAFANRFGMNAYFPRLASHGLVTDDPLLDMTPDNLWESAKEALMVASTLGERVIIMGTSTGGTLALKLAAEFPEYVDGLILYSPNIRINNNTAFLLSRPWGLQLARKVTKGKYRVSDENPESEECRYWYCSYRLEGVVYLQQLVDATMNNETFSRVTVPVFLGYYYRDESNQDETVRVDAMLTMFDQLGTSPDDKVKKAFPDAGEHVIASKLTSGSVDQVIIETVNFGEMILNLKSTGSNRMSADF
jgi:esterase/lipase